MKTIRCILLDSLFCLAALLLLCNCQGSPGYPHELLMADSAYRGGDYRLGDSILKNVDKTAINEQGEAAYSYFQLLQLERDYLNGSLASDRLSVADSLCSYYGNGPTDKRARAHLFLGYIMFKADDYPIALEHYLKARDDANSCDDKFCLSLTLRSIGNLYYTQRMLNESVPFYRSFYQLAAENRDTLRMAYAASHMGDVCIIQQNIDSIIYFYQEAIALGKGLAQEADIVPIVKSKLCDVYIQLEEYDKAKAIMPRDSLNDANWAYWHYGQNHADSAIYYFQKTLGRIRWGGDVEALKMLAQLEEQRGNIKGSLNYYEQLAAAEDSLKAQRKTEETLRTQARHNYDTLQQERDRLEHRNSQLTLLTWLLVIAAMATLTVSVLLWRGYRQRKLEAKMRRQLVEKEQKEQQLMSQGGLLDIEKRQLRRQEQLQEFKKTALYQRLKAPAQEGIKSMTEEEWQQLKNSIDSIYDNFTFRLLNITNLSKTELRICYLLKMEVPPKEMADILNKTKSAITQARKRMLRKLTGEAGKAEKLDEIIQNL